jgi:hypothetical protein
MMASCREILGDQHQNMQKDTTVPASKGNGKESTSPQDSTPGPKQSKPLKIEHGKKTRAQDTLKPIVAIA